MLNFGPFRVDRPAAVSLEQESDAYAANYQQTVRERKVPANRTIAHDNTRYPAHP